MSEDIDFSRMLEALQHYEAGTLSDDGLLDICREVDPQGLPDVMHLIALQRARSPEERQQIENDHAHALLHYGDVLETGGVRLRVGEADTLETRASQTTFETLRKHANMVDEEHNQDFFGGLGFLEISPEIIRESDEPPLGYEILRTVMPFPVLNHMGREDLEYLAVTEYAHRYFDTKGPILTSPFSVEGITLPNDRSARFPRIDGGFIPLFQEGEAPTIVRLENIMSYLHMAEVVRLMYGLGFTLGKQHPDAIMVEYGLPSHGVIIGAHKAGIHWKGLVYNPMKDTGDVKREIPSGGDVLDRFGIPYRKVTYAPGMFKNEKVPVVLVAYQPTKDECDLLVETLVKSKGPELKLLMIYRANDVDHVNFIPPHLRQSQPYLEQDRTTRLQRGEQMAHLDEKALICNLKKVGYECTLNRFDPLVTHVRSLHPKLIHGPGIGATYTLLIAERQK